MLLVLECLHTNPFAPAIAFVVPPWLTLLDLFLVVLPLKVPRKTGADRRCWHAVSWSIG